MRIFWRNASGIRIETLAKNNTFWDGCGRLVKHKAKMSQETSENLELENQWQPRREVNKQTGKDT